MFLESENVHVNGVDIQRGLRSRDKHILYSRTYAAAEGVIYAEHLAVCVIINVHGCVKLVMSVGCQR